MTDGKIVKGTAREPERKALGPMRGGIRAAARKVAKKVVKKTEQKKTSKATTATAGRTTRKVAKSATRTDRPAKTATPASKTTPARSSTARAKAAPDGADAAAAKAAPAAPGAAFASDVTAAGPASDSESVAGTPAASPLEPEPSFETPRPPAPIHPGAFLDSTQEHAGGFGSVLALWGPLIIVGFLVLVFRGGEERESTVTASPDAPTETTMDTATAMSRDAQAGGSVALATETLPSGRMPGPADAARGSARAFDRGFTMRTSMASPSAGASERIYPSPPGPYRDPRYRGLPPGERWPATGAGEWLWSAEGREGLGYEMRGDAPVQWVRCAPPYYWCPAPGSPTW